jgi:hypothetical protein
MKDNCTPVQERELFPCGRRDYMPALIRKSRIGSRNKFWKGLKKQIHIFLFIYFYLFFAVLRLELRAYTLSHSTRPFL